MVGIIFVCTLNYFCVYLKLFLCERRINFVHRLLDASGTANSVITAGIPSFSLEKPVRNLKCSLTEFISSLYDLLEVAYSVPKNSVHSQDEVLNATR